MPSILLGAFLLGLVILFGRKLFSPREAYPYHALEFLLTPAEQIFFRVLVQAVPQAYLVTPKVRLGDVIGCSDSDWVRGFGPKISAKHLDFVVVDRATTRIRLAVELDDASHNRPERKERDIFLNGALAAAGVPLLRVPAARSYNRDDLKTLIESTLPP